MNRKQYEDDLKYRQQQHLNNIENNNWQPCLHDGCPECLGTGRKHDGSICIHGVSCSCKKCLPRC